MYAGIEGIRNTYNKDIYRQKARATYNIYRDDTSFLIEFYMVYCVLFAQSERNSVSVSGVRRRSNVSKY